MYQWQEPESINILAMRAKRDVFVGCVTPAALRLSMAVRRKKPQNALLVTKQVWQSVLSDRKGFRAPLQSRQPGWLVV
jgi:hypothetical protein